MTFLHPIVGYKPKFLKMHKGPGNIAGVGNSYNRVTGMVISPESEDQDALYSNGLVVDYDAEPYQAVVYAQIQWFGGIGSQVNCQIRRGGSVLITGATVTNSLAYASTTILIQPNDSFEMYWRGEGNFLVRPSLFAGVDTFLKIEPL